MSVGITLEMDRICEHVQQHRHWEKLIAIEDRAAVFRQDDVEVGLLKEPGITNLIESKQDADADGDEAFVDCNLAVSKLSAIAKALDPEFQNTMKTIMSRYGDYIPAPIKVGYSDN